MLTVAAFYKFTPLTPELIENQRQPLLNICNENEVKGIILLATEGVNGTICCENKQGVEAVLTAIMQLLFPTLNSQTEMFDHKFSHSSEMPFRRMKVHIKNEICTMGVPNMDPIKDAGVYVKPDKWNELITSDDVALIDTRNDYEVAIGSFANAIDPNTKYFAEFPDWLKNYKQQQPEKRKLAMYCTGGIRCEKATAFAKSIGFEEVYHLQGGILKYLEEVPEAKSTWKGDCYVFDDRVSVKHGLELGEYGKCRACARPVAEEDKQSDLYVEGVSCAGCRHEFTDEQREKFSQRQRQYEREQQTPTGFGQPWVKPEKKGDPNSKRNLKKNKRLKANRSNDGETSLAQNNDHE
eukprot:m.90521 g.90521  ORF g.90521 m.90521 type:complete len:352 (-) comp26406_c0_seq1:93-1148(-)